ncbi:MAG: hypothetical protein ABSH32_05830 [Bryobacteraceae bacterium]
MLKKIGLPLMAIAAVFMLAPHSAKAGERSGVDVETSADCPPPAPPVSTYVYANSAYVYAAPVYVAVSGVADRHEDRSEHRRDERRDHEGFRHDRDRH